MTQLPEWALPKEDDTVWARGCRLLQARWREQHLNLAKGPYKPDQPDRLVASMLPVGDEFRNSNFLSPEIVASVDDRLSHPEYGGIVDEDRLRRNLLSSQPLCFNLFGYFRADPEHLLPWVQSIDAEATSIADIRIEWAPDRTQHFDGGSAFDAFVEYGFGEDGRGFVALECKYAEDLVKSDVKLVRPIYHDLTSDSGDWLPGAVEVLDVVGYRQIWLNTLLARSLLTSDFDRGHSVVMACRSDLAAGDAVEVVRAQLVDPAFLTWCPYEELLEYVTAADAVQWKRAFTSRYLDFGPVGEWLAEDDPRQASPDVLLLEAAGGPVMLVPSGAGEYWAVGVPGVLRKLGSRTADIAPGFVTRAQGVLDAAGVAQPVLEQMTGQTLRLTQESQRLLRKYEKVHSAADGTMLGIVRAADTGHISGHLTFVEPTNVAGLVSTLPMLASGLAMQAQMARIERALATISEDVDYLIRSDQWTVEAALETDLEILGQLFERANETGGLSDDEWDRLVATERSVRQVGKLADKHLTSLKALLADDGGSLTGRLRNLKKIQGDRVGPWLMMRIQSDLALARWNFLHVVRKSVTDPSALPQMILKAREDVVRRRAELEDLAKAVDEHLRLETSSGFLDKVRILSQAELRRLLLQLAALLEAYEGQLVVLRPEREVLPPIAGRSISETVAGALKAAPGAAQVPLAAGRDVAEMAFRRFRPGRRSEDAESPAEPPAPPKDEEG